ncbi:hypothetical protein [Pseudomonas sp. GM48]|uniref:hypothetical protein n=1 Tax=Pseudomonas sp. GM48 TaxID=1144330 RepID=UPI0005192FB9|nr:hypothetical protein [Pseudomonas sp. GM48]
MASNWSGWAPIQTGCRRQVPAGYGHIGLLPADRLANWICRFVAAPEAFDLLAQQVDFTAIEFVTFEALAS